MTPQEGYPHAPQTLACPRAHSCATCLMRYTTTAAATKIGCKQAGVTSPQRPPRNFSGSGRLILVTAVGSVASAPSTVAKADTFKHVQGNVCHLVTPHFIASVTMKTTFNFARPWALAILRWAVTDSGYVSRALDTFLVGQVYY